MKNFSSVKIREIFDGLVPEYDLFNSLSSLGLDDRWRREVVKILSPGSYVLDVGTGTGALAKGILERGCRVVGIDFSEKMISAARQKFKKFPGSNFQVAPAEKLPFEPITFDSVVSAFVVRNLNHAGSLLPALKEFFRVLKPEGTMAHLELTRPQRGALLWSYQAYTKTIVPSLGWALFRDRWPRSYLNDTIKQFPSPEQITRLMRWAGFKNVCYYPLSGGIASLFTAQKCST